MTREPLPQRRYSETFQIGFAGERYHVTAGFYDDGRLGEVFVNRIRDKAAARLGEQLDGVCRDGAILVSFALQHGAALDTIRHALTRNGDGSPSTIVGAILDHLGGAPPTEPEPAPIEPGPLPSAPAGAAETINHGGA